MTVAPGQESPSLRTRRGEEREARLRARAATLFLERGYAAVTIDEIVRDVGGSKTSVYSYYGGKEGLFLAVVEHLLEELVEPLKQLDLSGLSLENGLTTFGRTLVLVLLQERHLAFQRLVIAEGVRHPKVAQKWYQNGPATSHAILERFLAGQQQQGNLRKALDLTRVAILFHDMVTQNALLRGLMMLDGAPDDHAREEHVRHAVRLVTLGMGAK